MTIRNDLLAAIRGIVGDDDVVHVVPYQDNLDRPDRPTIMFKQTRILPLPAAPRGGLRFEYVLTFIAAEIDAAAAETFLDEFVPVTLRDFSRARWSWEDATKVVYGINPAYDVVVFAIVDPDNSPPPVGSRAAASTLAAASAAAIPESEGSSNG